MHINELYIDKTKKDYRIMLNNTIDVLLRLDQRIEVSDEDGGIVLRFATDPVNSDMGQDRLMWVTSEEAEEIYSERCRPEDDGWKDFTEIETGDYDVDEDGSLIAKGGDYENRSD